MTDSNNNKENNNIIGNLINDAKEIKDDISKSDFIELAKDGLRATENVKEAIKSENTSSMLSKMAQGLFSGGGGLLKSIFGEDENQKQKNDDSINQSQDFQNIKHTQQQNNDITQNDKNSGSA